MRSFHLTSVSDFLFASHKSRNWLSNWSLDHRIRLKYSTSSQQITIFDDVISTVSGKLSDNSGDVVNLIMERLEDIVKKTQLNPETPPDSPLRVTVVPHCVGDQVHISKLDLFNGTQNFIHLTLFRTSFIYLHLELNLFTISQNLIYLFI